MPIPNAPVKPWYREPWPWLLMLGPLSAVIMGGVMVVLAVSSNDGLVVDDYYKQGLAINQTLRREHRAEALSVSAALEFARDLRRVKLTLREHGLLPEAVLLTLVHPTRAGHDQQVLLVPRGSGVYEGALAVPTPGRWHLVLEDAGRSWRLTGTWLTQETGIVLGSAAETAR
jgi:hypothetical protein